MADQVKSAAETRIETLTEAIEALCLSSVVLQEAESGPSKREKDRRAKDHEDAREALRVALREFTSPLVRLISGGLQKQEATGDDRVVCGECSQEAPCHRNCCFWHAAIAKKIDTAPMVDSAEVGSDGKCTFCDEPPVQDGERCPHKDCPHAPAPEFA